MTDSPSPAAEYEARLAARRASLALAYAAYRSTATARFLTFVAGLVVAWLALDRAVLPAIAILVPVLAFVGLVLRHGRITHERDRCRGAVRYYERGLARLGETWPGTGTTRADFAPATPAALAGTLAVSGHVRVVG